MMDSAQYMNLPFEAAIAFFKKKLNIGTDAWDDLWQEMHIHSFSVAGVRNEDLLDDLRTSIDQAISEGTTLDTFRKDFDRMVKDHGWNYKGGRKWRSAVIYDTNLTVAYQSGHWKAMTDPAVTKVRPFLRYVGSTSLNPRPDHQAWADLVLPWDDPWWDTHYPPNGWGCHCGVVSMSQRQVDRLAERRPIKTMAPAIEYYDWTNKDGQTFQIPQGIDPGWAYNVGKHGLAMDGRFLPKEAK
ncbi:MAG: hypothetical protein GY696_08810 [Gammaproteobacteria bacterium]|nr:hypothetical protein [Gammaproteobacteria bacterium]